MTYKVSGYNNFGKWEVKRPTLETAKRYADHADPQNLNVKITPPDPCEECTTTEVMTCQEANCEVRHGK